MDAQMKKGILEMCILHIISQEELYGYPIMKKMNGYFPDVDESTFYAILRRFTRDGLTEAYSGKESNGPRRKYYRITQKGREYLQDSVSDWRTISRIVSEIGIR